MYSIAAMPIWVRAVMRMPTIAIASMTTHEAVSMPILAQVLVEVEPNTASTDGPRTTTSATVPTMLPTTISQPVRKPRYGLMDRPTHSKDAPQLAFHRFSRR